MVEGVEIAGASNRRPSERSLANLRPRWKPGESGNPTGRAPSPVDIAALCREHGPRGVEVAAKLMDDPDPKIRLAAVLALWDRGFGKPVQAIASTDDAASLTFLHLVAARAFSEHLANDRVKDADVVTVDSTANGDAPVNIMTPALE